ncbi:aquaporin [Paraburkholderia sp. ZP32-5]|uniref:aquaporin n=1 Tax=Paraburkholderia sp. ZP32-5 TaxID=2883245 RepID=UPI001F45CED9|nr:aquaporin [Paraburkholderia sp. ZP32-5]
MTASTPAEVCFFERDPNCGLLRRAVTEAIGTLMLMFAATGSAVIAASLGAPNAAALLLQAFAVSGALVALIIAFGAVSGGHFNPIITAGQWIGGERTLRCTIAYIVGQMIGAVAGAVLARCIFAVPAIPAIPVGPAGWAFAGSELVATAGLMVIVFGCSRARRSEAGPFAVGAWLVGMIMSLPSSYANPALVVGAIFAVGPIKIALGTIALFIPAQVIGGLVARAIVAFAYGGTRAERLQPEIVALSPHED